ncbi:hypothetical protein VV02_23940 [Luteipulveratus mongoliensis]|uniref:HTH cro/C1-type domain-containing protein n=1 Tax=Luteipulveratus mongoliensis TaxID=571913 RepID=A0A0K1JRQ8_9MICO|nr:hypothetical protein VV02_23940 [Luteipulveratus mongoliensis]
MRDARESRDLSYGQLESETGIGKGTLFKIEAGQSRQPDQALLQQIADTLDLPLADLYAAAGYDQADELPTLKPYLRTRYPALPETALHEIAAITKKYGIDPSSTGPRPGEDER